MRFLGGVLVCLCAVLVHASATSYTPPKINGSYVSRISFDGKGLQTLYDVAEAFLRGIQRKDPLPPGLLTVVHGQVVVNRPEAGWADLANYYTGILVVAVLSVILALATPVVALAWCCCSCCCCGSSSEHRYDDDDSCGGHDGSPRRKGRGREPCIRPLALAVLTCVALSGAVVALVSNVYLDKGIGGISGRLVDGLSDVRLFVDNAATEVDTLMVDNYDELSSTLQTTVRDGRANIEEKLNSVIGSLPLDTWASMAAGFGDIHSDLDGIHGVGEELLQDSKDIVDGVGTVKQQLELNCPSASCPLALQTFLNNLTASPPFPQVEDVHEASDAIKDFTNSDFAGTITTVKNKLNDIQSTVHDRLEIVEVNVKKTIQETGSALKSQSSALLSHVNEVNKVFQDADDTIKNIDKQIEPYDGYRMASFTVFAVILMVICGAVGIGLLIGCCSKNHSYCALKPALWLVSLTLTVLLLLTTALFLVGVIADRACEAIRDPDDGNQIIALVDDLISQNAGNQSVPVQTVGFYVKECRNDHALYTVLDMASVPELDIDRILTYAEQFDQELQDYLNDVDVNIDVGQIVLVPQKIMTSLEDLTSSGLAKLNFGEFQTQIAKGRRIIKQITLSEWADQLDQLARNIQGLDVSQQVQTLKDLEDKKTTLNNGIDSLEELVTKLGEHSRLGYNSLEEAVDTVIQEVGAANATILATPEQFKTLSEDTVTRFKDDVKEYLGYVVQYVKRSAMRCGPLARVYDATITGLCDDVFQPWNAFWVGAGLSLLLFVPMAMLGATLT